MLQEMGLRVWAPARKAMAPSRSADQAGVDAEPKSPVEVSPPRPPQSRSESLSPRPSDGAAPAPAPQVLTAAGPPVGEGLAELARTIATCQACRLCQGRRAPVFDAAGLAQQADWLVVGDPPEAADEQAGQPFAGPAGQLLDNMLRALGLQRTQGTEPAVGPGRRAYLTTVVKCRSDQGGPPEEPELAACHAYLQHEIAQVRPRVILALGKLAAQSLLQPGMPEVLDLPLGQLRGRIYQVQGVALVVSYSPAYLMRNQADKARAWADLCLARSAVSTIAP